MSSSEANRLPEEVLTPRLILRVPRLTDAPALNRAVRDSFSELNRWMEWAIDPQTMDESQSFCRDARVKWHNASEYPVLMILKESGVVIGGCGYPDLDWDVPKFEIGYWCHTAYVGRGYVSEAACALTKLAFGELGAARVEVRMDDGNERSWRVVERLGFELEAVIRADARNNAGDLRDTRVYAMFDGTALAELAHSQ